MYDTFDCDVSKVVTIIPIIKDEGSSGNMDYLQWDTLSLMSLLNVYVILAFYDKAEIHRIKQNKITNQKFHNGYIKQELEKLCNYHQSALHWNLNQLKQENLSLLIESAKQSYTNISRSLGCTLHNPQNIDKFVTKITQSKDSFMEFSRSKAKMAQNREIHTTQPKEFIGIGKKTKIMIQNYLGGQYFFTIDVVLFKDKCLYLCESKHSKNTILPSEDDIKDGLLKLMLYNNIDSIQGYKNFKVVLRLTSNILQDSIALPNNNLELFLNSNPFSSKEKQMLLYLNLESNKNHFSVWINYDL